MIGTIFYIEWLNLKRDRIALALVFLLPILFFSIFALIFGSTRGGTGELPKIRVAVVDLDQTDLSRRIIGELSTQNTLLFVDGDGKTQSSPDQVKTIPKEAGRDLVLKGKADVVLVFPGELWRSIGPITDEAAPVELIYDAVNPAARYIMSGLLQQAVMVSAVDVIITKGLESMDRVGMNITPSQWDLVNRLAARLRERRPLSGLKNEFPRAATENNTQPETSFFSNEGLVKINLVDVRNKGTDPISYYAAGIAVMFLLFSMAGAAGSILEEEESGTLDRILNTSMSIKMLLLSKWAFSVLLGVAQIVIMFLWGWLVFGIPLWTPNHLAGLVVIALATSIAASSFGMVLAALCRTRAQLTGISTIVILIMSALGGSMLPRFVMPAFLEKSSRFTLNGWALDGFLRIFWYSDPHASPIQTVFSLWPEVLVLVLMSSVFLSIALGLSGRWKSV